jgi:hypothetical protein
MSLRLAILEIMMQPNDTTWRDRYGPSELSDRLEVIGMALAEKYGMYNYAEILSDAVAALREMSDDEDSL